MGLRAPLMGHKIKQTISDKGYKEKNDCRDVSHQDLVWSSLPEARLMRYSN